MLQQVVHLVITSLSMDKLPLNMILKTTSLLVCQCDNLHSINVLPPWYLDTQFPGCDMVNNARGKHNKGKVKNSTHSQSKCQLFSCSAC